MLDKKHENMSLYYDGELTGDELEAFESKLFENPEFAQEYTNYAQFLETVINTPMVEPPEGLRTNIMKRVHEEARPIELIGEKPAAKPKRNGLLDLFQTTKMQSLLFPGLLSTTKKQPLLLNENIKPQSFRRFASAAAAVVACVVVLGAGLSMLDAGRQMQFALAPSPAAAPAPAAAAGIEDTHTQWGEEIYGVAELEADLLPPALMDLPVAAARADGARGEAVSFGTPIAVHQDLSAEDLVIRSASITVEVEDFDSAMRTVNFLAGYNENITIAGTRNELASAQFNNAWIDRRVPLEQYNESLNVLRNMGRVTQESEHTSNVGTSIANAQARASALNHEIARLFTYLEHSETISDLTLISSRIGMIEQETIDAQRQVHHLAHSVAEPMIDITIIEVDTTEVQPANFFDDVSSGFIGSLHFISRTFTGLVVLIARFALPTLIVATLAFIFIRVYRGFRKPETSPKEDIADEA